MQTYAGRSRKNEHSRQRQVLPVGFAVMTSLLLGHARAGAQVNITSPNPAIFTTSVGQTLSLNATLQNLFSSQIFFTGDNINFVGAQPGNVEIGTPTSSSTVAVDDTPFVGTPAAPHFPNPLAAGEQRTVPLANIFVGTSATLGTYNGYFTLQGGATNSSTGDLVTQNFRVIVTAAPVPEASTLLSLGLLTGAFVFGVARSRRDSGLADKSRLT